MLHTSHRTPPAAFGVSQKVHIHPEAAAGGDRASGAGTEKLLGATADFAGVLVFGATTVGAACFTAGASGFRLSQVLTSPPLGAATGALAPPSVKAEPAGLAKVDAPLVAADAGFGTRHWLQVASLALLSCSQH